MCIRDRDNTKFLIQYIYIDAEHIHMSYALYIYIYHYTLMYLIIVIYLEYLNIKVESLLEMFVRYCFLNYCYFNIAIIAILLDIFQVYFKLFKFSFIFVRALIYLYMLFVMQNSISIHNCT